ALDDRRSRGARRREVRRARGYGHPGVRARARRRGDARQAPGRRPRAGRPGASGPACPQGGGARGQAGGSNSALCAAATRARHRGHRNARCPILLNYIAHRAQGFINKALNSLKTFQPGGQSTSVGAHLYNVLVSEGRLRDQYPDFVKEVLLAAVPEPGLWTFFWIVAATTE